MSRESLEEYLRVVAASTDDPKEANKVVDRYLTAYDRFQKYAGVVVVPDD